ncbi:MAG: GNAT family N-acetyltransferase [Pseudonocardiaceae bacterium]
MYVRPSHRGRGLGRRILQRLEMHGRSISVTSVILETGITTRRPSPSTSPTATSRSLPTPAVATSGSTAPTPSNSTLGMTSGGHNSHDLLAAQRDWRPRRRPDSVRRPGVAPGTTGEARAIAS